MSYLSSGAQLLGNLEHTAADRWHRSTAMKKNTHERRFSSPPL